MRSKFAWRIRCIALGFVLIALVLLVRLYDLQVIHGTAYRKEAEAQYVKQSPNQTDRGNILFTSKDGSLISAATQATGYTVAVNPSTLKDAPAAFSALTAVLPDLDEAAFMEQVSDTNDTYAEIARRVTNDKGRTLADLKIPGVQVLRETWRYYPGGALASHTIGFLGYGSDGHSLSGQYGLERFYDETLTKTAGGLYVNFFADLFTNIRSELAGETRSGGDIVTSIEPSVQQHIENALLEYGEAWRPRISGAVIMDPKTGALLAFAARPNFDLNDFNDVPVEHFANPLVESVYEFGSTMKPLTIAAGIDAGAITPGTTYDDKGYAVYDGSRINNFDGRGRGVVSMQEVLGQSLNTGVAFAVTRMGTGTFRDYFEKFGLMEETGIDLPNEESPLVDNLSSPRTIEYVTASFGQGIAVTPVAMARALATLANHGKVPSPHVGVEIRYGGGLNKALGWSPDRVAISPESAEAVTRMLVKVVDTQLLGGTVKIPEYSIAAKTGTAQIAKQGERGYYDDRYLHSFFGYFPAYEPRFLIFLFASEPEGARYASETWTRPFMDIVKFLINYYDIPPDRAPDGGQLP